MLQLLHIENIALIERADITFEPGFNVLTGETGAGKSIVIDAISAALGQRTSRDLIRTGAQKATVSAVFSGVPDAVAERDENGDILLQRELFSDGRNVCRINGNPATVGQLKALGTRLLNIHGQHDGQQLLDPQQHIIYLDRFGQTDALWKAYQASFHKLSALLQQIRSLQMDEAEKARRIDTLRYQIDELERAQLQPEEEEALSSRRNFLRNSEKFITAVTEAEYALNGEEADGAVSLLRRAQDALRGVKQLDDAYAALYDRLESVYSEVYDIADTLRDRREDFSFSPRELDEVEGRMDLLYRLKKKYGATVADMLDYLERCRAELASIEDADDTLALLERQRAAARKEAQDAAQALSDARREAGRAMAERICRELSALDMGKIRFCVSFAEKPLDESGMDDVQFLMSANAGEELRAIHKIASGGELARIMLALRNVLSRQDEVSAMVFDEVDTGVSGRAAQKVAEKMAHISRKKQVLCVTHLPQLAAMADTHFSVEKGESGGRTYTRVTRLDRAQRREELARLTGGVHISPTLLSGAEELLSAADSYKSTLIDE